MALVEQKLEDPKPRPHGLEILHAARVSLVAVIANLEGHVVELEERIRELAHTRITLANLESAITASSVVPQPLGVVVKVSKAAGAAWPVEAPSPGSEAIASEDEPDPQAGLPAPEVDLAETPSFAEVLGEMPPRMAGPHVDMIVQLLRTTDEPIDRQAISRATSLPAAPCGMLLSRMRNARMILPVGTRFTLGPNVAPEDDDE